MFSYAAQRRLALAAALTSASSHACLGPLETDDRDFAATLAGGNDACAECFRQDCEEALHACEADTVCAEFAKCRWDAAEGPDPGNELRCSVDHSTSTAIEGSLARGLSTCWENQCVAACQLGTRWGCVNQYAIPSPAGATVRFQQTVQGYSSARPIAGATIRFCPALLPPADCPRTPDATAVTDADGIARVELPVSIDNRPGWIGYRQVEKAGELNARLLSNLPAPVDSARLQHVPTVTEQALLAGRVEGLDPTLGYAVFQVFDCAHTGAEGIHIQMAPEPDAAATLRDDVIALMLQGPTLLSGLAPGTTLARGNGGGIVINLPFDTPLRLTALRGPDVVAELPFQVAPGELLLLEIYPNP